MVEVERKDFMNEVYEIKEKYNVNIKEFEDIYKLYEGQDLDININSVCDKVIQDMFGLYGEPSIPYSFIISNLGKVIISVKLGINRRIYTTADLVELTGFSKQQIAYDINAKNIKAVKKKGFSIFYENDVIEYLEKKGLGTLSQLKSKIYAKQEEEFRCGEFEREVGYGEGGK